MGIQINLDSRDYLKKHFNHTLDYFKAKYSSYALRIVDNKTGTIIYQHRPYEYQWTPAVSIELSPEQAEAYGLVDLRNLRDRVRRREL